MPKTKNEIQKDYIRRSGYKSAVKYNKNSTKCFIIRCVLNTENDIIQKLETESNKSGYIKSLIRADLNKVNS
jgi:hypothetical protein